MKALLIAESRQGKLLPGSYETLAFAGKLGAESSMFLVGSDADLPKYRRQTLPGRCRYGRRIQPGRAPASAA